MKALVLTEPGKVEWREMETPVPAAGQVLVRISAVSLNRRDAWIKEGKYPGIRYGSILGADGAGTVVRVGDDKDQPWVGQEVVINPNINWGSNPEVQSKEYSILGMPVNGTFAEYVVVNTDRIHRKPQHLDFAQTAALPLSALTAFRAVFRKGHLSAGQHVLISGFGGGVAQFAFLFARAAGAHVHVTTGTDEKVSRALLLGAEGAYNYNNPLPHNIVSAFGGFDLVIDSAGGDQLNDFLKLLKPCGKIVFYGATNGLPAHLDLYRMFWNQLSLIGTTMGNDHEFQEMLQWVAKHQLKPIIDAVLPFSELAASIGEIQRPDKVGKIVFQV